MRSLILLAAFLACAQAQQAPFIPITGPNALKGASLLFEDSRGGLWMGGSESAEGVRYYDGSRFLNPVLDEFPHVLVTGIQEDSEGGIWLATTGGLFRLTRGHLAAIAKETFSNGFARIAPDVFLANIPTQNKAQPVNAKLLRVMKYAGAWHADTIGPATPFVRYSRVGAGRVLAPRPGALCEYKAADIINWRPGMTLNITSRPLNIPGTSVLATEDRAGCVWIRAQAQTFYMCAGNASPIGLPADVASISEPAISELPDGSMVIASLNRIAIGRPGNFRVISTANGLAGVASHLARSDGSIWISNSAGLFVLSTHLNAEFWTERDGLNGSSWSVLPLGKQVFAVSGDTVCVLDNDRRRWRQIASVRSAINLSPGPDDTIFVSSLSEGIVQIRLDGSIVRKSDPQNVMSVVTTPKGEFWSTGNLVARVALQGSRITFLPDNVPNPQGRGSKIMFDKNVGLVTCYSAGLVHKTDLGWQTIADPKAPPPRECIAMTIDHRGALWYGFHSFFVAPNPGSLNPEARSVAINGESGDRPCCAFLGTDRNGILWRGSPNGVYVADPDQALQGNWLELNRDDGLPGNDTNENSFVNASDGSLWFGIDNSVVHVFPNPELVHPTYVPSVFVSGFSSNNSPFQMADLVDNLQNNTNLTAHLGSLQMDRRNALNFRYRFLPEQTSWTNGTATDIKLGKVSWGDHKLEVQARLLTGPWSQTASKSFHVLRPFWLSTPWLVAFVLFGGTAAVGGREWRRLIKHRADTRLPEYAAWCLAVVSPELNSLEGKLLDNRFQVLRIVARGGFATVWEGHDRQQSNRLCAIKVFRHELLDKSWMQKRFQHEVAALTQIQHPNVVRIYGHGTVPSGAPYLAMEFIHGETLRDKLMKARLTVAEAASYLRQTANALAEIHAHGVCHRDVKPENLMIRTNGQELVLIDFSIAIVQDPDETIHGLSRAAGTMHYMAPEQAIGYANESSDIYSLAKILIEMLTGQRLSTLLPDASIDLPDRVRELELGLSPESTDLLAKALEFDPSRRPKDASAFGEMLATDLEKT